MTRTCPICKQPMIEFLGDPGAEFQCIPCKIVLLVDLVTGSEFGGRATDNVARGVRREEIQTMQSNNTPKPWQPPTYTDEEARRIDKKMKAGRKLLRAKQQQESIGYWREFWGHKP